MILLDSHAYFWWTTDDRRLSPSARAAIEEAGSAVFVSAVVAWEITTKVRGRWSGAQTLVEGFFEILRSYEFAPLPITLEHAHLAGSLPGTHRDPFDRMLAAQSQIENLPLVTADPAFREFGTRVLW